MKHISLVHLRFITQSLFCACKLPSCYIWFYSWSYIHLTQIYWNSFFHTSWLIHLFYTEADKFLLFLVTPLDVVKIRLQVQRNPFPKGILIVLFCDLSSAWSVHKCDVWPHSLFKCLSGKCFVYCNGLMDHLCVCENGNSKAWYKAPGHFNGTLVKMSHTFCVSTFSVHQHKIQLSKENLWGW